jgi:hypothetical protein
MASARDRMRDRTVNIIQCANKIYISNVEYQLNPIIEQKGIKESQIYCLSLFNYLSYHVNKVGEGEWTNSHNIV